jgi:prepilin-type N-terminal cleavage/methylation domain-containing protein
MQLRCAKARRSDDGFTLIELLMAVVIIGIITVPLGNLLIEYFQNTTQTTARLNESHDAQIAAAYFATDIASVGTRDQTTQVLNQSIWTGSTTGAPYACGGATTPLVLAVWDQFTGPGSTPTTIEASYFTRTVGTESQLVRVHCSGSATADSTVVLAHDIDSATAPTVACSGGGSTACSDHPLVPTTIKLVLSIKDPVDRGSAYSLTLTGQRRQTS